MRVALDTNILVYAEGVDGPVRRAQALGVIAGLDAAAVVVPVQALGELFRVLVRKAGLGAAEARTKVESWAAGYEVIPTTEYVLNAAMDLVCRHRLAIWDAVMLAAAAEAGCDRLLTEDMQDGFTWRGVTVRNPFRAAPPP